MHLERVFPALLQRIQRRCLHIRHLLAAQDKQLHMRWSFWMTLAAHVLWPISWAITAVFLLGLAKEFWDRRYGSGFCFVDIASNVIGIAIALGVIYFLPKGVFG